MNIGNFVFTEKPRKKQRKERDMAESNCLGEFLVIAGLMIVQLVYAINSVIMSHLMSIGLSPLFLMIYGSFATALFLFPLSVYFERSKWPSELNPKLFGQFLLISFGGALFQYLMLIGVKKTSPAVACAMPNLAPGLIFVIAWILRFEKVNVKCMYSRIKILGTLICIIGAVTMSVLHAPGPNSESSDTHVQPNIKTIEQEKIVGIVCLIAAVIVLSCIVVLQAATLAAFPAPMSLCVITSFMGAIITGIVKSIEERGVVLVVSFVRTGDLIGYSLLGGIVSGASTSYQSWAMNKKGPVYVSTFNPVGTVCSVILSALTLGESITLGTIIGMLLMFAGLYLVLWTKKKEELAIEEECPQQVYDAEKPLLH